VHAVGPIWHGGGDQEETKLEKAVLNSLKKAEELQARSVALPAISSGIFGVPATLEVAFSLYSLRPRAHGEHTLWCAHDRARHTHTHPSLARVPQGALCRDHGADDDRFLPPAKADAPQGRQVSVMTPPSAHAIGIYGGGSQTYTSLLLALLCAYAVVRDRLTNFDAETVGIFKRKLTEKFPAARVHRSEL